MRTLGVTISATAAAVIAATLVLPFGPDALAGKPGGGGGGGGGTMPPAGEIVFEVQHTSPTPSEFWITNAAGTSSRALEVDQRVTVVSGTTTSVRTVGWTAVRQGGRVWFAGATTISDTATGAVIDRQLVAVRDRRVVNAATGELEPDVEVVLATQSATGLSGAWSFVPDASGLRVGGTTTSAGSGVFRAALHWDAAGMPSIAGSFTLELPWAAAPGWHEFSDDGNRAVIVEGNSLRTATRNTDGTWTVPSNPVLTNDPYTPTATDWFNTPDLSPDGTRILYKSRDGIRFMAFDGTANSLAVADTGGGASSKGTGYWDPSWAPDSIHFACYELKRTGTFAQTVCWARATTTANLTPITGPWGNGRAVVAWLP